MRELLPPIVMTRELSVTLAAALVAITALVLHLVAGTLPNGRAGAAIELAIGAPMLFLLLRMSAESLYRDEWSSLSGAAIRRRQDPAVFWVSTATVTVCGGVFLLGVGRALLSLALPI